MVILYLGTMIVCMAHRVTFSIDLVLKDLSDQTPDRHCVRENTKLSVPKMSIHFGFSPKIEYARNLVFWLSLPVICYLM